MKKCLLILLLLFIMPFACANVYYSETANAYGYKGSWNLPTLISDSNWSTKSPWNYSTTYAGRASLQSNYTIPTMNEPLHNAWWNVKMLVDVQSDIWGNITNRNISTVNVPIPSCCYSHGNKAIMNITGCRDYFTACSVFGLKYGFTLSCQCWTGSAYKRKSLANITTHYDIMNYNESIALYEEGIYWNTTNPPPFNCTNTTFLGNYKYQENVTSIDGGGDWTKFKKIYDTNWSSRGGQLLCGVFGCPWARFNYSKISAYSSAAWMIKTYPNNSVELTENICIPNDCYSQPEVSLEVDFYMEALYDYTTRFYCKNATAWKEIRRHKCFSHCSIGQVDLFEEALYTYDYCHENIVSNTTAWSSCINGTQNQTTYYTDLNYAVCCAVTGIANDCDILTYINITTTQNCTISCFNHIMDGTETSTDYGGVCGTCFDNMLNTINGTPTLNETEPDYNGVCGACNTSLGRYGDEQWLLAIAVSHVIPFNISRCANADTLLGGLSFFMILLIIVGGVSMIIVILLLIFFILTSFGGAVGLLVRKKTWQYIIDVTKKNMKRKKNDKDDKDED